MVKGILIERDDQSYHASLKEFDESLLSQGDVKVKVKYSSLNYKDALAITGKGPIIKQFPMVPGIDLAGQVESSASDLFKEGDWVLLNGFGVGEKHTGGLADTARVKSEWLTPLPKAFNAQQAMAIGTAGYTAMLCVMALEKNGVSPEQGEVIVSGANGGVGSVAVHLLSRLGFDVAASTGRPEQSEFLKKLGAKTIIDRNEFNSPGKPLVKERWAGAVDTLGSHTLANICAATKYGGTVAACGLAQGADLPVTVMPFILRGVTLAGIDSVMRTQSDRAEAWERLAEHIDTNLLNEIATTISLSEAVDTSEALIAGKIRGRIVVEI